MGINGIARFFGIDEEDEQKVLRKVLRILQGWAKLEREDGARDPQHEEFVARGWAHAVRNAMGRKDFERCIWLIEEIIRCEKEGKETDETLDELRERSNREWEERCRQRAAEIAADPQPDIPF